MKKVLFAIAAVAMLFATSCKKDNNAPENIQLGEGEFLATIDNGANPQNAPRVSDGMTTKTHIDANNYVIWDDGDVIYINGKSYATTTGTTTAVFAPVEAAAAGSAFHAFYAVENPSATEAAAQLPATQTYTPGRVSNLPMYATCGSNRLLTFQNICAALKITVPVACDHIVVSATENICGGFEMNGNAAVLNGNYGTLSNSVNVVRSADSFAKDEVIYVAIPEGTYTNFTITLKDASDQMLLAKVSSDGITVAANNVYNVTLAAVPADCFHFTAETNNVTIGMSACTGFGTLPTVNLEYCKYNAATGVYTNWTTFTVGTTAVTLANTGDKAYFRAGAIGNSAFGTPAGFVYNYFTSTGDVTVSGNVMYLLNANGQGVSMSGNAFFNLFHCMTTLKSAADLELPATTLNAFCYSDMFYGCSNMTAAPELSATNLVGNCYDSMFNGCSKLSSVTMKATTGLNAYCCLDKWLQNAGSAAGCAKKIYVASQTMADWFNSGDGKDYAYGWTAEVAP